MIKHRMGCFVAFFSLAYQCKATRWRYKTWTYPIPASTHCRATIGPPAKCHSKCFRCCIAKKEERKAGGGVGDRLESPVETHSMFVVFFLHVLLLLFFYCLGGGGVNC